MPSRKPKPPPVTPEQVRSWWNISGHIYALCQTSAGRGQLAIYLGLIVLTLGFMGLYDATVWSVPEPVTPDEFKMGWDEETAKTEAPKIAAMMPKFAIFDANGDQIDGAGKSAELWKFAKLANEGQHIPTWRQESGDCVSMGWANAIAYRQAFQIAKDKRSETLKIPFPPYMYGVSRVAVGRGSLGRGAGSIGAWAAKGSQSHGVYTLEQAEKDGYRYSGRLADQWGQQGSPKSTIDFGRKFRINTVSQITSWNDCRDALTHGYPVTVASNVGFTGGSYDRDGKRWMRAGGNWGHQMCFIGCEDRPGKVKGCYCLNSWGKEAHPAPLNDEPPGGFWVDAQTVQRMVSQGDSWAYSDFDGFPATDLTGADWQTFREDVIETGDTDELAAVDAVDVPEEKPALKETRKMWAFPVSCVLLMLGLALGAFGLRGKFKLNSRTRTAATLLLGLGLIGSSLFATVEAGSRRRARLGYSDSGSGGMICSNGVCRPTGSNSSGGGIAPAPAFAFPSAVKPEVKPVATKAPEPVAKSPVPPVPGSTPKVVLVECKCGAACKCREPVEHQAWQTMTADPIPIASSPADPVSLESPMPTDWNAFEIDSSQPHVSQMLHGDDTASFASWSVMGES